MPEPEYFDPRSSLNLHWRQRDAETHAIARKSTRSGIQLEVKKVAKKKWNGVKAINATLTMKQAIDGFQAGYSDAIRELDQFLIRLNRKLLKRAFRDGHKKLKATGNAEVGDKNEGWHLHCQIEWLPYLSMTEMEGAIEDCWRKSRYSLPNTDIKASFDPVGWEGYQNKQDVNPDLFDE